MTILYTTAPRATAISLLIRLPVPNSTSPIITDARPMTTIPVPMPTSEYPWYCASIPPARPTSPFDTESPRSFILSLLIPAALTISSLSPVALSAKPFLVLRNPNMSTITTAAISAPSTIELHLKPGMTSAIFL